MTFAIPLSKAWVFIALTYLFALLPWTVLANLDFIGSDWRTVKATRTSGWYHFCFVIIPIPLIIFYIVVFWNAMDYTESCAAFLGLYVSFVHFIRTSWRLWQIYLFHSWATQAIESMEEMGYKFKLRFTTKHMLPNIETKTPAQKADMILVNNTIIDNQMFHGETQCYLEYRGKVFSVQKDPYGEKAFLKRLFEGFVIILHLPFLPLVWILDLLRFEIEKSWIQYRKIEQKALRYQVLHLPFKPVDVWLNWSTAFAAQGLSDWIEEFEVASDPDMKEDKIEDEQELYQARRDYFAGELLAGMSHLSDLRDEMESENMSMLWEHWDVDCSITSGTVKKRELLRAACESGKGLPFGAEHILNEDSMRRFIVEGLEGGEGFEGYGEYQGKLEWVIASLPVKFGRVITEFDIERLEWLTILLYLGNVKKEMKNKLYLHNETKKDTESDAENNDFTRIKENENSEETKSKNEPTFQVGAHKRDKTSDGNDLKFINAAECTESLDQGTEINAANENKISKRSERCGIDMKESAELNQFQSNKSNLNNTDVLRHLECGSQSNVCPDERYLPFRNLMSQLGFGNDQSTYQQSPNNERTNDENNTWREICSFAVNTAFSRDCMKVSRTNRHALRVGEMSDIWMQLEAGKHYKFLQDENEWWKAACLGSNIQENVDDGPIFDEKDCGDKNVINNRLLFIEALRMMQKRAERSRLRYQLGDENQKYSHFEHSLTFMGYGMEFVRSELGHWVSERDKNELKEAWRPLIQPNRNRSGETVGTSLGFLTGSLSDSIMRGRNRKLNEQRNVQIRLLWEMQQLIQEKIIINTRNGEGGPSSQLAMMHCIIGFPALIVEMDDNCNDEEIDVKDDKSGNCMICFCNGLENEMEANRTLNQPGRTEEGNVWKLHLRPQCAPQALDISVHLRKHANGRIYVTAGIDFTKNEQVERFEWEWWRDSFLCRLEGLRSWQEEHQLPSIQCQDTVNSIADGVEFIRVSEIGTGEQLRTWKGWKPFRKSICRFELESPGYIHRDKKIEPQRLDWIQSGREGTTTTFSLNRIERVSTTYDQAGWRELHNCFLTMKDVLEESQNENRIENGSCNNEGSKNSTSISVAEKVDKLLNRGEEGAERAVLLLREMALKEIDGQSLERCVQLMSEGTYMRKDLRGAIDLLHRFLTYGNGRRSHKEVAYRAKILASTAISQTRHLWLDQEGRSDLFQVLRLVCVRALEINEIDDLSMERFEWLLSMLRVRVMQHRETATFSFLASAQQDIWKAKNHSSRVHHRLDDKKRTLLRSCQDNEPMEDVNSYFESCAIYQRGVKELETGEHQSWLMNCYGLQLQYGINGENKDVLKASQLYERASEGAGHTHAMYNLACVLQRGAEGVNKDTSKAIQLYERAIDEDGHAHAMYNLALMIQHGADGVAKDLHRAVQLYERAIDEAGHAPSMNNLARLLEDGNEVINKDMQRAIKLYERAINEAGHALSMNDLACILEDGTESVPKDVHRALQLYERAIDEAGHTPSMYNLARMLQRGAEGVDEQIDRAIKLYQRAIDEEGHVLSMYHLARLLHQGAQGVDKDVKRAIQLYERAIDKAGHVPSMYNAARLLQHGTESVEKDVNRAIQLYERAIDGAGHVLSMNNLAHILEVGVEGAQKDIQRAIQLYERAIDEEGHAFSMFRLAFILHLGVEGVQTDLERAVQLYERAINEVGDVNSMYYLACILQHGVEGVSKDIQRAMQLYERAIEKKGHAHAMYNLAVILHHGLDGVEQDTKRAIQLYERAVYVGRDTSAMNNLGFIFHYGADGTEIDLKRAKELYEKAIELGNEPKSMYHLACLLHHADNVVIQKDVAKAKELYQRAIDQGNDIDAMFALGKLLESGDGVVRTGTSCKVVSFIGG